VQQRFQVLFFRQVALGKILGFLKTSNIFPMFIFTMYWKTSKTSINGHTKCIAMDFRAIFGHRWAKRFICQVAETTKAPLHLFSLNASFGTFANHSMIREKLSTLSRARLLP
jgi:hypothetical protein